MSPPTAVTLAQRAEIVRLRDEERLPWREVMRRVGLKGAAMQRQSVRAVPYDPALHGEIRWRPPCPYDGRPLFHESHGERRARKARRERSANLGREK